MMLAPASTSTSLIAPASSLSSSAGRLAKTESAAIRLVSTPAHRATKDQRGAKGTGIQALRMSSPLASAVHDDACLLRRERHPDGHLAELDEPRARRLIVLEGLLHSSLCNASASAKRSETNQT